ncbi:hypothetical protein BDZ89DRAFT_1069606 [Hymenopellis radicata]|nr:hypothetical protein BDZ89DRAFT_1069606 [Hymenopellis radicata]
MSLPLRGEYFVFELDPVASIATFEDPIATKACEEMHNKQYLACVIQWQGGIPVVDYPCALDIMLVSTRGMVPGPEDSMLPEMSCPILSNSSPHPLEREPVDCTPPLPWPDCFHPTLARTTVRIQYETQDTRDHGKYQLVPHVEAVHLIELNEHDAEWRQEIDAAYQELHEAEHDTRSSRSSYNVNGTSSASSIASVSSLQIPMSYDEWLDETPIVKFSFDLEKISAQDISNPWEYQEEREAYTKVQTEAKRRVHQKVQETRKLDDELFPAPCVASDPKPIDQPEPTEGSAPPSPRIHGNGQTEASDWSSDYEEPTRSLLLDDSTSPKPSASPTQAHSNADTPPSVDPRERLTAALDLEPRKVSNAPLTKMPDRVEYITWEREINIKMEQMFTDIMARGEKQDKEGADDAIVKRTHLQMLCLPDARPQHMEALAAVFQRERESMLVLSKPESNTEDESTDVPTIAKCSWVSRLTVPLKKLGTFFGCHSLLAASTTEADVLDSPSSPRREPSGSLLERLRHKLFGRL